MDYRNASRRGSKEGRMIKPITPEEVPIPVLEPLSEKLLDDLIIKINSNLEIGALHYTFAPWHEWTKKFGYIIEIAAIYRRAGWNVDFKLFTQTLTFSRKIK